MGKKKHSANMMFTIMLLGVFALVAVFSAVMGARVYASNAENLQANFDTRTSIIYLSEKIRTCAGDNYDIRDVNGNPALVLSEEIGDTVYESWIFVSDGQLCEATIMQGDSVLPGSAQKIMAIKSFNAELNNGGIELSVTTDDDQKSSTFISGRFG